jgi:chromosome segregation ATPase
MNCVNDCLIECLFSDYTESLAVHHSKSMAAAINETPTYSNANYYLKDAIGPSGEEEDDQDHSRLDTSSMLDDDGSLNPLNHHHHHHHSDGVEIGNTDSSMSSPNHHHHHRHHHMPRLPLASTSTGTEEDIFSGIDIPRSTSDGISSLSTPNRNQPQHQNHRPTSTMSQNSSSTPTPSQSLVNGLLSPFSPLLKVRSTRAELCPFVSLQPCRKVSVVVRVLDSSEDDQRCVFPLTSETATATDTATTTTTTTDASTTKTPRDLVVVKPSAFGKYIPSRVTMETARLVAQVAHIASEDWARLYEFHHVMWPPTNTAGNNNNNNNKDKDDDDQFSTMNALSRAVVQDCMVEHQSSLLISLGQEPSCVSPDANGLLSMILQHLSSLLQDRHVCSLQIMELQDDNQYVDLLDKRNDAVALRYVDQKGGILHGLTQIPLLDEHHHIPSLLASIHKRRQRKRSSVICQILYWENAVSYELQKQPTCTITCVELSSSPDATRPASVVQAKSTVSLGRALRQLLVHSSSAHHASVSGSGDPMISYRESHLTKVLQRPLETSQIVLVGSISPLSSDYEQTLATLNYIRRLLDSPGKTANSPFPSFKSHSKSHSQTTPQTQHPLTANSPQTAQPQVQLPPSPVVLDFLNQKDERLLEQMISDPRQRLAKIVKSTTPSPRKLEYTSSQDDDHEHSEHYRPFDYLQPELSVRTPPPAPVPLSLPELPPPPRAKAPSPPPSLPPKVRPFYDYPEEPPEYQDYHDHPITEEDPEPPEYEGEYVFEEEEEEPEQESNVEYSKRQNETQEEYQFEEEKDYLVGHDPQWLEVEGPEEYPDQEPLWVQEGGHVAYHPQPRKSKTKPIASENDDDVDDDNWITQKVEQYEHQERPSPPEVRHPQEREEHPQEEERYEQNVQYPLQGEYQQSEPSYQQGDQYDDDDQRYQYPTTDLQIDYPQGDEPSNGDDGYQDHGEYDGPEDHQGQPYELSEDQSENQHAESPLKKYLDNTFNKAQRPIHPDGAENADPNHDGGIDDLESLEDQEEEPRLNESSWLDDFGGEDEDETALDLEPQTLYDVPEQPFTPLVQPHDVSFSTHHKHPTSTLSAFSPPQRLAYHPAARDPAFTSPLRQLTVGATEPKLYDSRIPRFGQETPIKKTDESFQSRVEESSSYQHNIASVERTQQSSQGSSSTEQAGNDANRSSSRIYLDDADSEEDGVHQVYNHEKARTNPDYSVEHIPLDYLDHFQALEGAVNNIRSIHAGVWQSSAGSLERLKESLEAQQQTMALLRKERDEAQSNLENTKEECQKTSEEYDDHLQRYEEEVQQLHDKLDTAVGEKGQVEKVADEAISAQDRLEAKVKTLEANLLENQRQAESSQDEFENLRKDKDGINEELIETRKHLERLDGDNKAGSKAKSALELSLRQVEEDRLLVERERLADRERIESLEKEVGRQEASRRNMEEEHARQEKLRLSQVEGLQSQSRKFGTSLENFDKERAQLQKLRKEDGNTIEELREEVRDFKLCLDGVESEKIDLKKLRREDGNTIEELQEEVRDLQLCLDGLESEKIDLEKLRRDDESTMESMRQQLREYKESFEYVEIERMRVDELGRVDKEMIEELKSKGRGFQISLQSSEQEQSRLEARVTERELTIERLQVDLESGSVSNLEMDRMRQELSRVKHENVDMESTMARRKAEYYEDVKIKEEELLRYKIDIDKFREEVSKIRDQARKKVGSAEQEIRRLMDRVSEYDKTMVVSKREREEVMTKVESLEMNQTQLSQQLDEKDDLVNRYGSEVTHYKEELSSIRERERSLSSSAKQEMRQLGLRISELNSELLAANLRREEAESKLSDEMRDYQSRASDLDRTQMELDRQKSSTERLSSDLERTKGEKRLSDEKIARMESLLQRFQSETKDKVDRVVSDHRDSAQLLETSRLENKGLSDTLSDMERLVQRLQRERDALHKSLSTGRDRLATLSLNSKSVAGRTVADDSRFLNAIPEIHIRPLKVNGNGENMSHVIPELYLTDTRSRSSMMDQQMSLRAEEIAACLAVSAKNSLHETQDEASHLRWQVHRLEQEKEMEVSSLKKKIRALEMDLTTTEEAPQRSSRRRHPYRMDRDGY